jgi:ATP-dependent Lhr-like helicase
VVDAPTATTPGATEWGAAMAQQLLTRHGVITRETVSSEAVAGGFAPIYQVLKAMEETGRIRRGYFVAGLGAAQFAMPAALDLLRSMRDVPETPRTVVLAATDPANPCGSILPWPEVPGIEAGRGPTRTVGARAILVDGRAVAYLRRGERELLLFLPESEPRRSQVGREVAKMLVHLAASREEGRRGMLLVEINGEAATAHPAARLFIDEGFAPTAMGLQARISRSPQTGGIRVAGHTGGGHSSMADPRNDREAFDQDLDREDVQSDQNRSDDDEVRGHGETGEDVDPDDPEADIDRDDSVTD